MITAQTGIKASDVRQGARHVLFVEGNSADSIDVRVLQGLFGELSLSVEPLGPSYNVKSAAQALFASHPTYYFLIDRDHTPDNQVEELWNRFPDLDSMNLLIWRRKEIESYFLQPEYLGRSKFLRKSQRVLATTLIAEAQSRLFIDVANYVITGIRDEFKSKWIQHFTRVGDFTDSTSAKALLVARPEFLHRQTHFVRSTSATELEAAYDDRLVLLTGGASKLTLGKGRWQELMEAKPILNGIVSKCFNVVDTSGSQVHGNQALRDIARELLLSVPLEDQPQDFIELKRLVEARMSS